MGWMAHKNALPNAFSEDNAPLCLIVGAGDCGPVDYTPREEDLVIAADGGYLALLASGVRCDLLMGDLDSLPPDTPLPPSVRRFDPIKDDTDLMLAVREGLSRGFRRFLLYGVFGGRLDHTLATCQTILFLAKADASVLAFEDKPEGGGGAYVTAVRNGTLTLSETASGYLSLFPLEGEAHGVTLEGLQYPLQNATLYPSVALGVSNACIEGKPARITVSDGTLLVVKPL